MAEKYLALKALVFVTVCAYFAYAFFWSAKTLPWMVEITLRPENYYPSAGLQIANSYSLSVSYVMEYVGFVGLIVRLVGAGFALSSAFLILKSRAFLSSRVRGWVSKALFLEGIYFFSFIPAIYYLLSVSSLPLTSRLCLSTGLAAQIVLISPALILLSRKLGKDSSNTQGTSLMRLAVLSSLGYVVALWVTYLLKWIEMAALEGAVWLVRAPRVIAFSNTIVVFSLSVAFAIVGAWQFLRKSDGAKAIRWWGLSAVFLSLHLIIFVLFCISYNAAFLAVYGELWIIPLLGLGAYMLFISFRKAKPQVLTT